MTDTVKNEDEREKFEAWVAKGMAGLIRNVTLRRCECSEDYFHSNTQAKWEGWQARAAQEGE